MSLPEELKVSNNFGNVLIIGLGMIGGSVAKALKDRGLATLYGSDRRETELSLGVSTGVIDFAVELTPDVIEKMDVILLATPVRAMEHVLEVIAPMLRSNTLVTDVGSTKASVIESAKRIFGSVPANFIPGHPIAGAEKSGVLAANPHLFENHKVIVTPLVASDLELLDRLHLFWSSIGAEVVSMDVDHHDLVLAGSSHLPHLLAYTLVDSLANSELRQDVFRFAAGGFRDFTRIASSDPVMWRDVFLVNKDATLVVLNEFMGRLDQMKEAIEASDSASMFGVFTRAKSARDHFMRLLEERAAGNEINVKSISISFPVMGSVKGRVSLSGDKSLSHRAIAMAALSEGVSVLSNLDIGSNAKLTVQAFRDMGVVIEEYGEGQLRIHGVGLRGLKAPIAPINVGNSSTTLYILLPVLAGQDFEVSLIGEGDLLNLPLSDVLPVLRSMGADVSSSASSGLPVHIKPDQIPKSDIVIQGSYSQAKMAAILAGCYSTGDVSFGLSVFNRNHTENLMAAFGCKLTEKDRAFDYPEDRCLKSADITLPADVTKTAWLILLATILPGSRLEIENILVNSTRTGYLSVLKRSGANIMTLSSFSCVPEVSESVLVQFSSLSSFLISEEEAFLIREELVFVCVAAVFAKGKSRVNGLSKLPFECEERLRSLIDSLMKLNVTCSIGNDYIEIEGSTPQGGELDCAGDYLLAMAQMALGARSSEVVKVQDCFGLFEEFSEFERVTESLGIPCLITQ
ncbi:prephenate dehydrogenase/arogenate dehydrogenase family protein [Marinomonas sp. 2405UD68-3]|uniref:prephenate dehydrogenase/arogenate dehydrogenase family protein n=1 Tax=Marinomonas sp. 2405UD68-3 TaxID=3391835 RepID=UPI0039C8EC9F